MAGNDPNTKWPILNQLPDGPTKENLIEIKNRLEDIWKAKDVLLTLSRAAQKCDMGVVTVAPETLDSLAYGIDADVDEVFYHLNKIFEAQQPVGLEGGAQISPGTN